ncbi:TPR-like protein [Piromyces finnis]|uniref:TPR-like protein n=1 Tax=Piromyces finnis TaxID=1754191 RepID=A0A1Y1V398_9FUNG|nr:TPR-like protein [Piromyces finnis]|eukprot:ORX45439.1 TPR-like protein [Piromyces finnis]
MSDSEEEWADAISSYPDEEFKDAVDDNIEYYFKRNPVIVKKSLFTLPEYNEADSDNEINNSKTGNNINNNNDNSMSHSNSIETINNNSLNDNTEPSTNKKEHLSAHRQPPIDLRKENFNITNIMEEETMKEASSQETLHESEEEKEIRQLEEEIDKILSCSPEEIEGLVNEAKRHKELGNQHFKEKNYIKALDEYKQATDICPHSQKEDLAIYYNNMAACYVYIGTNEQVATYCTRALDCNPNYVKALVRRAYANEKIGKSFSISQAIEDHKKVLELDPDNNNASRKAIGRLEIMLKVQQEKEKEEMLAKMKDVGNKLLGKLGLSLDNFNLQQNANGGYSINMNNSN